MLGIQRLGVGSSLKSIKEEKIMENLLSNLIDFVCIRNNLSPPIINQKLLLREHEKVYYGCENILECIKSVKKKKFMKKAVFIFVLMLSTVFSSFAQQATIDGSACASAPDCQKYVCENSTIDLLAGITSGSIDSLVWRERIWDGTVWGAAYQVVSTNPTISVPVNESATMGHVYRYQLIIYQSGNQYYALSDVFVNSGPTATLLSDYTTICAGSTVTFTASAGGTTYDFKVNGVSQYLGPNSSWSSSTLANNDQVTVTISNGSCSSTSSPIPMTVRPRPDAASVTPSSTCLGEEMDWTYSGLTGTGPWVVSFWDPTHTTQYGPDYNLSNPIGSINDVPIPYGTPNVHFKIEDNYCPNF